MKILLPLAAVLLAASQALAQGVPTPVGPPVLTVPIFANATITSCATPTFVQNVTANTQLALFVNIKASPTGTTPTLTWTIAEVDPGDQTTAFTGAQTASTASLNAIGAPAPISISTTHSTTIKVSCVITGAGASFTQTYVTVTSFGGALSTIQGAGVAGTPAGGLLTTTPPLMGQIPTAVSGSLTPADTPGSLQTLNTACSTGVSCAAGSVALVQTAGQQGSNLTLSSASSPLLTLAADCATDGGTAWSLTGSPSTSGFVDFIAPGGVRSNTLVNPAAGSYQLVPQAGCVGTTFQVRVAARTSGSINAQARATAISQPPYVGGIGASSYPSQAVAMMAQDSSTATTSRAVKATANGVQAEAQGQAADGATIAGNPVPVGYKSVAVASAPSTVTAGQETYGIGSIERIPYVRTFHPNLISCTVNASTATALTALGGSCAAPGAGVSIYITDITASASAAGGTTADSVPTLKSGTGGTCGTGTATIFASTQPANGGFGRSFATPLRIAANSEVCWINSTAGTKWINIQGFIAP